MSPLQQLGLVCSCYTLVKDCDKLEVVRMVLGKVRAREGVLFSRVCKNAPKT